MDCGAKAVDKSKVHLLFLTLGGLLHKACVGYEGKVKLLYISLEMDFLIQRENHFSVPTLYVLLTVLLRTVLPQSCL